VCKFDLAAKIELFQEFIMDWIFNHKSL